jgi:hypothetical protein
VRLWLCTRCVREMKSELPPPHIAEARLLHLVSGPTPRPSAPAIFSQV